MSKCVLIDVDRGYWTNGVGSARLTKQEAIYLPVEKIKYVTNNSDEIYEFLFYVKTTDEDAYCLSVPTSNNVDFVKEWLGLEYDKEDEYED